jgi:tetratricopeptide (TPR) repeat protein
MALLDQRLCPCGSGLRRARCCRLDRASLASPAAMKQLAPLVKKAEAAFDAGEHARAEALCHDVLELAPGQVAALKTLHRVCAASGRQDAAEALVRRIVTLDPNNLWALNELALRLRNKGSLAEAEIHARNAVRVAPENPQAHNLMGMILTEVNRPRIGEYHYASFDPERAYSSPLSRATR